MEAALSGSQTPDSGHLLCYCWVWIPQTSSRSASSGRMNREFRGVLLYGLIYCKNKQTNKQTQNNTKIFKALPHSEYNPSAEWVSSPQCPPPCKKPNILKMTTSYLSYINPIYLKNEVWIVVLIFYVMNLSYEHIIQFKWHWLSVALWFPLLLAECVQGLLFLFILTWSFFSSMAGACWRHSNSAISFLDRWFLADVLGGPT